MPAPLSELMSQRGSECWAAQAPQELERTVHGAPGTSGEVIDRLRHCGGTAAACALTWRNCRCCNPQVGVALHMLVSFELQAH
jgi:hypothetical protein